MTPQVSGFDFVKGQLTLVQLIHHPRMPSAPVMSRDAILDAKEKASISFTAHGEQVTVGLTVVRSVTP